MPAEERLVRSGRVALVTGANRGIGREVMRQPLDRGFRTILTARDLDRGRNPAADLGSEFLQLDVSDQGSVHRCFRAVEETYERLDVLIGRRSVLSGAASVMWGVLLDDDGATGGFLRDGRPVPW